MCERHVALASAHHCRCIVSWNFKHIVHFDKIPLYNGVNLINGFDGVLVGPKIIDAGVKKRMKAALKDIQTGKFAKEWVAENKGRYKKYNALLKAGEQHPIEKTGARLRSLMPWIKKKNLKGAQAAY